jgi:hypothetical protein
MALTMASPPARHQAVVSSATRPACRLEIDVNSSPDYQGDLAGELVKKLFLEFVQLAREIATRGDV